MPWRNLLDDASRHHFVGDFVPRPLADYPSCSFSLSTTLVARLGMALLLRFSFSSFYSIMDSLKPQCTSVLYAVTLLTKMLACVDNFPRRIWKGEASLFLPFASNRTPFA